MASEAQFDAALDLLRRLPPTSIPQHLTNITALVPSLTEDLLSSVDQPLSSQRCPSTGRDYLLCDYNRDGDSYRSPWSNEFSPPLDDATYPSDRVRKMEVEANSAFEVYRQMYYEGGIGSVYLWDLDDGFAGVVLLKKKEGKDAGWDSIHVFEVDERRGGATSSKTCHYKLTSTVILHLGRESESLGELTLAGSMTRQVEADLVVESVGANGKDGGHVVNAGRLIEDMEGKMRNMLQEVYFGKAKDVVGDLRSVASLTGVNRDRQAQRDVISSMGGK
ncbi:F-actin-capping protein subunit beta [Cladophialophora carrionii]|uniref:F-actin-capping protein subunit beta n=1 Tax=Cladophialophora carrionii TaxID=86049 RepID=A0A1C1CB74_9EURO|nr:F-actin-capping protein subunit beta [Cladophialophora carrionii]